MTRKNHFVPPLLLLIIISFASCMLTPEKEAAAPAVQAPVVERRIEVIQEMRTQAVSRRVGRWAVVIGISDYRYDTSWNPQQGIPDLKYAARDARAFAAFLMSPAGGAFPVDRVRLLLDEQATVNEVRAAVGDFLARSLEDDWWSSFLPGTAARTPRTRKTSTCCAMTPSRANFSEPDFRCGRSMWP